MSIARIIWITVMVLGGAGCTLVSGGDDLQAYEEVAEPKATCSPCDASLECASNNCRQIECNSGQTAPICLPEGTDQSTQLAAVPCDWDAVCP